jgi:hypothetical protein
MNSGTTLSAGLAAALGSVILAMSWPATAATSDADKSAAKPAAAAHVSAKPGEARKIEWEMLLPEGERDNFSRVPPAPVHDYLGEAGGMAALQSGSVDVNKQLDEANVTLPGFIVPLSIGKDGVVNEFFLVPYFGACIHVPPPPPNQIVYVKMAQGVKPQSMNEAYWITGKMHTTGKGTSLGMAAYSMDGSKIEIYDY